MRGKRISHLRVNPEWGTHFAISEIEGRGRPLVWIDIDDHDSGVVVGNKLSDAVERAFNTRLFGYGLPLNYCVKRLEDSHTELGEFYFVASGTPAEELELERVFDLKVPIVLCGVQHKVPKRYASEVDVLSESDFSLTLDDALNIALDRAPESLVKELWSAADGEYESFIVALQSALGLPPPERPYPDRYFALGANPAPPRELIDAHIKRGFWIEAFEVAIRACPERIDGLIENAAEQYLDKGLMERLSDKLSHIPHELYKTESVAYWTLTAAIATNSHRSLIPVLKKSIDLHAMPDVRALIAIQNLTQLSLSETRAAYESRQTLITTRAYAFCLSQFGMPEQGLALLMSALKDAQAREKGRELISIGSDIAHGHSLLGDHQLSLTWAEWALAGFKKYDVKEDILQLFVKSQVQYMRLLTGDLEQSPVLSSELVEFDLAGIPTYEAVISTLGDFEFVQGRYAKALELYERNRVYQSREQSGHFTLDTCRALLALGRKNEALELADGAVGLAQGTNELNRLKASIAKALSASSTDVSLSRVNLEQALEDAIALNQWDAAAICSIALASLWLDSDSRQLAVAALTRGARGLEDLGVGGWRLFGGWHLNFDQVCEIWGATRNPSLLSILGVSTLSRNGEELKLGLRHAEILALLTMHPEGLTGEQLSEKLYLDERQTSTLKATLSKLRRVIPIESQPYRIAEFVKTDAQSVEMLLKNGNITEAIFSYTGPILPESAAPAVVAYREYLDEAVRQAALTSTDIDSLFEYAQKRGADLEVWEALLGLLPESDSRTSFVRARVLKLRQEWGL